MKENQSTLRENPSENNTLNKMIVVFRNESTTLNTKMNSIKITLMGS